MKTRFVVTLVSIAAALLLATGCAYLPPTTGTAPTATQTKVSGELQSVADAIRHVETLGWPPARFNAFLDNWVALIPGVAAYLPDAKLAYSLLYAGGDLSVAALERLAQRYDS